MAMSGDEERKMRVRSINTSCSSIMHIYLVSWFSVTMQTLEYYRSSI